ncbi:TetR/AcrR family transcriptional regulator [Streptomyces gibsoniae]|uniref:TetR/AcrR family transcriptional regulator n=1 Tax=Streptomyces gibsoniae TaxID=3075529 RepID=A0ABU2U7B7_9ACTN|nr:TetR/AcrR family transcriptional regulator [Streptomyces sp. DSM 41699]MDT0469106.1 TetR/AcrR family transcriptional regulator [Streptomyces sp. DSM 41699]
MADRPLRADAQRNRRRILEVALRAFSEGGADVPLDAIAREAGVGSGTLYRHFPTREALVEAVYHNELGQLCESADELLATATAQEALRTWMGGFLHYARTKLGLADALGVLIASGANPYEHSRARILAALTELLEAAIVEGSVRDDLAPFDVLTSLSGIALASTDPQQHERLLDLLVDGLQRRPAGLSDSAGS